MDIIEELKGMDLYDQDGMRFIDSFLTGFPSCCGAIILHELDFCSNFKFKEITKKLCEVLESNADQNEGVGSFIAISNQDQEELFEDTKWLPVHTFINPNSGNELTYWVLSL